MSRTDLTGAVETGVPRLPDESDEPVAAVDELVEGHVTRREQTLMDDEAAMLGRENSATAREDAALSREEAATTREDAAHLREGEATSREGEMRVATALQSAADERMRLVMQTNARLVIATVDAQKLTARLEMAQIELERAKSAAEKANRAKSDFLSSMSHELRTPLNAILGFAQLMETGTPAPTPTQAANIGHILQAGWYLLNLINQILDLSVIESGRLPVSLEPVALADVMRECQNMIEPQAQERELQVTFHPFDNTWSVNADPIRVKQVVINLLSNAIKYNRAQGTIDVICTVSAPERLRITVKDSGAGLSADNLTHLFEPFNRLGQEAGAEEGTGIGLVVSKQLVELMGGAIGVNSIVGVGSEFWIELCQDALPQLAGAQALAGEKASQAADDTALRTFLYVEDNPSNLMLVAQIIESHPHIRMLSASDGELGLALARAHRPDVILMDINLRGLCGYEVLKHLRADPLTARISVLAISANAMPGDIEKGLKAGFLRYLTKPIKVNEFMDALNQALERPGEGGSSGQGAGDKQDGETG